MTSPEIIVPCQGPAALLGAATYLAVLSYPDRKDNDRRQQFIDSVRADHLKRFQRHPLYRRHVKARFRQARKRDIESTIERTLKRIEKRRLPAAYLVCELMLRNSNALSQPPGTLLFNTSDRPNQRNVAIKAISNPSSYIGITQVLRAKAERRSEKTDELEGISPDFDADEWIRKKLGKTWSTSRPVLHLAVILLQTVQDNYRRADGMVDWDRLIREPEWVGPAIDRIDSVINGFSYLPKLRFDPTNAVILRRE